MITAETITAEHLRDLQARLGDNCAELIALALSELAIKCPRCDVAPGTRCTNMSTNGYKPIAASHPARLDKHRAARARCAEILNARETDICTECGGPIDENGECRC